MSVYMVQQVSFIGVFFTGILILVAILMKVTGGLFLARTSKEFINDKNKPKYEKEKTAGHIFSRLILKYVPAFFFGFLILLLWFSFISY